MDAREKSLDLPEGTGLVVEDETTANRTKKDQKKNWNVTVIFNPGPLAKDLASCYKTAEFITPIQSINFGFIFLGDLGTCTFM